MFHSEMSIEGRAAVIDNFRAQGSNLRCAVSTIAFGMGVKIDDVDVVMHWGLSKTPLAYWQEIAATSLLAEMGEMQMRICMFFPIQWTREKWTAKCCLLLRNVCPATSVLDSLSDFRILVH